ncbi:MAG: PACE efflux transporter [Burkholderiales bacterium]|nr:PACE efflux transporter [Burkholderiales bacterium]MDE2296865.1 PACE efflux transporter [Burkholderiales bacterium]MDE2625516.1 PACE efflux transporter [Burkholderiales bacterium]
MTPRTRRVVQALLYEAIAVAIVGPALSLVFGQPPSSAMTLALVMSTIALGWNYLFNALFERWESKQAVKGRSFARRIAHGVGFEGGLVLILVPVMAAWMQTSLLIAFMADLGILAFFFVYAVAFTWAFDRVFGLPASAAERRETS